MVSKVDYDDMRGFMGFPQVGIPQNGWFIVENKWNLDDFGVPHFRKTPCVHASRVQVFEVWEARHAEEQIGGKRSQLPWSRLERASNNPVVCLLWLYEIYQSWSEYKTIYTYVYIYIYTDNMYTYIYIWLWGLFALPYFVFLRRLLPFDWSEPQKNKTNKKTKKTKFPQLLWCLD